MNIKYLSLLCLFVIIAAPHKIYATSERNIESSSFVLFTLHNNRITLERYSLSEIKPETVKLSSTIREGHTLFKIGLSKSTVNASSLFFYPADQRYLVILAKKEEQPLDLLLSWAPLITQQIKQLGTLNTIDFSISHVENQEPWATMLSCQLTTENGTRTLSLLLDQPVQSACGAFIADSYFSYDKKFFSRAFNQEELEKIGYITQSNYTAATKGKIEQWQRLVAQTALLISHYSAVGLSAGKTLIAQSTARVIAAWHALKNYFSKRQAEKKGQKTLKNSLEAQAEFDELLEEAMNTELDFIPKDKPQNPPAVIQWLQTAGAYLLMRYIALEQKMINGWHWIWSKKISSAQAITTQSSHEKLQ